MQRFLTASTAVLTIFGTASAQDAELFLSNTNTVRSTLAHPVTAQFYPFGPTCPPGYTTAGPGVAPGTRSWTYTPPLRAQLGATGPNFMTVMGMIQTIRVGAAINTLPATNHYQMRMGIAPTDPVTGGGAYQKQHSATQPDLLTIADAAAVVNTRPRFEISTTLTTPVAFGPTELCLYLEFRGGEQQDDANNCQVTSNDYYGGRGPQALAYWGFTTGSLPTRTVTLNTSGLDFRPRVGLILNEPVFTATGPHANTNIAVAGEDYRGMRACTSDWSTATAGKLLFDVRAGSNYGSTGAAVVLLNLGPNWYPASIPIANWGNLFLNPADPALDALTASPLVLSAGGVYAASTAGFWLNVPPLGSASVGQFLKAQAVVFNTGFSNLAFTNSSSILIE